MRREDNNVNDDVDIFNYIEINTWMKKSKFSVTVRLVQADHVNDMQFEVLQGPFPDPQPDFININLSAQPMEQPLADQAAPTPALVRNSFFAQPVNTVTSASTPAPRPPL
jgi:hypothetical protein